jgi:hypothetical protein
MEFPNMKEWWSEDPQEVMSFVFWLQRQVPPTDKDKRQKALKSLAAQLDKRHKAPNKKAISNFIGESEEITTLIESYDDFKSNKVYEKINTNSTMTSNFPQFVKDIVELGISEVKIMEVRKGPSYSSNKISGGVVTYQFGDKLNESEEVHEQSVNDKRDRPLKAFVKKMVKNWGVSKEDVIYYIVNNIEKVTESEEVNEARSEASKIAKKSGVSKADVDKIQEIINNLTTASIAEAIATQTDMDVKQVEKVLTMMAKVYGGNLQIIIR